MAKRHNMGKSKLYVVWRGMKERCTNPNHKNYNLYKGKEYIGWDQFIPFMEWALGSGYEEGLTIDRINPNMGYSPSNCRFITPSENTIKGNKERKLTSVIYEGKEYTKKQLATMLGIKYSTLLYRIDAGKL